MDPLSALLLVEPLAQSLAVNIVGSCILNELDGATCQTLPCLRPIIHHQELALLVEYFDCRGYWVHILRHSELIGV